MENNLTPETFALTPEGYVVYYHGELAGIHVVESYSGIKMAYVKEDVERLTPLPTNFESILETALSHTQAINGTFYDGMAFALWVWKLHTKG